MYNSVNELFADEIEEMKKVIAGKDVLLADKDALLAYKDKQLADYKERLDSQDKLIEKLIAQNGQQPTLDNLEN